MKQISRHRLEYCLCDLVMVAVGWLCFNVARFYTLPAAAMFESLSSFLTYRQIVLGQLIIPPCMVALYALSGSYNRSNTLYKSRLDEVLNALVVSVIGTVGIFFAVLINDNIPERVTGYELIFMLLCCLFVPTATARLVTVTRNARRIRTGDYVMNTLVVGASPEHALKVSRIMSSEAHSGLKIIGCYDIDGSADGGSINGLPVYSGEPLPALCGRLGVQAVVVMPSSHGLMRTAETINELYALNVPLFLTPDLHSLMTARPKVSSVTSEPIVDITNASISPANVNLKRLGDIMVSAVALVLLSPLYAALAVAVKLDSRGPVFYRQRRIGYHKKPFDIIKFRTMRTDAEVSGPALTSDDDPRVTRVGRVLRKYRLDELPQFWNVLVGEMSLVGPRPEREFFIRRIVERVPAYSLIHQVRPGITSWGMVKYGYASSVDEMIERLPYDLLYIENVSLGVDLKILFHTVDTVINGRGR
ncbi:MAG: sugar transferase [Muribaculaceae bacterium]|nr:sugar transferase [Muribaculaceae bacterium]